MPPTLLLSVAPPRPGGTFLECFAMTPPRACTTSAAVRAQALEPAMDVVAIQARERVLVARVRDAQQRINSAQATIERAVSELADLHQQRVEMARRMLGFLDGAHARLQYAEVHGSYDATPPVDSEAGREIARRVREAVDVLAHDRRRDAVIRARADLHDVFATFGRDVFAPRVAYHVGAGRLLVVRGEFDRWSAEGSRT